jgi:tetratricopeptide (TPR) repeat protein
MVMPSDRSRGRIKLMMDPNNPVVKLCVQGMDCERNGDFAAAAQLFRQAWNQATTDFDRCIAAHYVARHQIDPLDELEWNQVALGHAHTVADDQVREFYPSLYLNLGKAYENVGNRDQAKQFYRSAADVLESLPEGPYKDIVRRAIDRAKIRVL